jgi:phosphoglycolate phosphatase-like HAD superfamily hydrolase
VPLSLEIVNPKLRRGPFRAALFDFDGTLSLIREGWSGIMADIGLNVLRERTRIAEPEAALRKHLEAEMLRLSGKPSLVQMEKIAEIVQARGGISPHPEVLLASFQEALQAITADRKRRLLSGIDPPEAWAVPGAHRLLKLLQSRKVELFLASGTELVHVLHEAELLQMTGYFPNRLFAPDGVKGAFHKGAVIDGLLRELHIAGRELIGFGDGYAETVEVKRVGGVAVGLASVAVGEQGRNEMKREMLIDLGADAITRDYAEAEAMIDWLFAGGD